MWKCGDWMTRGLCYSLSTMKMFWISSEKLYHEVKKQEQKERGKFC